jgi:polar amino acid transport system permease protein
VPATYELSFAPVLLRWPELLDGIWMTVLLSLVGIVLGTALGVVGALGRRSGIAAVRWAMRAYVELFRNTPMLVQLFLIYLGLPALGIRLSPIVASCVVLIFNNAAYTTEIVRAGIAATPKGLVEAGESLALKRWQVFVLIVIRPALAKVYPALVSQNVLLMLSTSITSSIGVQELTGVASDINSDTFRSIEVFVVAGVIYLGLNYLQRVMHRGAAALLFPNRQAWT